jgi:uncharacterized membrane protein (DUF2068 family)
VAASIAIAIAFIDFILAYGIWSGRRWAWYSSLAFSAIGIIAAVLALFLRPRTSQLFSLFIDIVIILLLMQPAVHRYFTRPSPPLPTGDMPTTMPTVTQGP